MRAITKLVLSLVLVVVLILGAIFSDSIVEGIRGLFVKNDARAQGQTATEVTQGSSQAQVTSAPNWGSSNGSGGSRNSSDSRKPAQWSAPTATPKPVWTVPQKDEFPATETFDAELVRSIQMKLIEAGFLLPVDGNFDPTTAGVVKAYQKEHKLTSDGIVGSDTAKMMGLSWKSGTLIRYAPDLKTVAEQSGEERLVYVSNRTNRLVVFKRAWSGVWYIELCVKVQTGDASKGNWTPDGVYSIWQIESYLTGGMSDGIAIDADTLTWIKTFPSGTPVVIDDRKFSPEVRDHRDYQEEVNG